MNIENDVFKNAIFINQKLIKYGFIKDKDTYYYIRRFLNNEFEAILIVQNNHINGKVIDLETQEEYLAIRTNMNKKFVNKVREEYKNILLDICNYCCDRRYFMYQQANRITKYIKDRYDDSPEFLWETSPNHGVFRNKRNKKWYGIIMNIDFSKISKKTGMIEIINVKLKRDEIETLLKKNGYYSAYHMNKKDWISIILNDTLNDQEIITRIEESYEIIDKRGIQ